jgi:hypothetical protein
LLSSRDADLAHTSPWVERRPGHFDQREADQQFGQQGQPQGGFGQQGMGQQLDHTGSIQQGSTQTYTFGPDGSGQSGQQNWRRQ